MSTTKPPLTELRDADIDRIDAVKGAANGTRFILAKAGAPGLVSAEDVRALIADPPAADTYLDPAGSIVKAELTTDERKDLSDSQFGYVDEQGVGHYPINDAAHVRNALSRAAAAINQGGDAAATARKALPKIEAAAKRMGIGEPAEQVTKAMLSIPDDMTLDALREGIQGALRSAGYGGEDLWVSDVLPGYVVYSSNFGGQYYRIAWSVDASGKVTLSDTPEAVRRETQFEPVTKVRNQKEPNVSTTAISTPAATAGTFPVEEARAVLKRAKQAAKAARVTKAATEAAADAKADQADASDDSDAAGVDDQAVEKQVATPAEPVSLKKAKQAAKAARLAKRQARDELKIAKARATLVKIGRRNSTTDQAHVDAIDDHAAALGASAHQTAPTGVTVSTDIAKASEAAVEGAVDIITKALGPLFEKDRAEITAQLAQVSEQLAKVQRIPLPGGPRVVMDRDGSVLPAGEGESGMSFEQAAILKAAERYPVGSLQRESLEKAAATSAIKEIMVARANA